MNNIGYQCKICKCVFDTESDCERHIEEHSVEDVYNKWFIVNDNARFIPKGYILMDDGEYILSGIAVYISVNHIETALSHYPLDSVKQMDCDESPEKTILDRIHKGIAIKESECRIETYSEWLNRKMKKKND